MPVFSITITFMGSTKSLIQPNIFLRYHHFNPFETTDIVIIFNPYFVMLANRVFKVNPLTSIVKHTQIF